jgi:NOL1/NOP2/fmu family ribosome biogenesis protein
MKGMKILRAGLHLGTVKKNRFEPSHALALSMKREDALRVCELDSHGSETESYLRGETLERDGEKGWSLVLVDGFSIGWGKQTGDILKNHYPRGLRR